MNELNIYFTPVIIVIGVTGNLMSFLVFTTTHLRRQSSSVYLASLAMADIGFLCSLFIVWLSWIKVNIFHMVVWCQSVVYLSYVCTFLSVWYVVSFTVERYIIVWYPLRKDRLCTTRRARVVVTCLGLLACVIYSFSTWTSGIVYISTTPFCMQMPQYYNLYTAITGLDSILTLVVPSIVVIVLNIRIIIKIFTLQQQRMPTIRRAKNNRNRTEDQRCYFHQYEMKKDSTGRVVHYKFGQRLSANNANSTNNNSCANSDRVPSKSSSHERNTPNDQLNLENCSKKCQTRVQIRTCNQYKTARMLIVVSTVFVILNLPGHVFRLHAFIRNSLSDPFDDTSVENIKHMPWQEFFQLVYHLNFALNFFIYSACGRQFRKGLKILYSRYAHRLRKLKHFFLNSKLDDVI